MATTEEVSIIRIRGVSEGLDAAAAKLKAVGAAQDQVAKSGEDLAVVTDKVAKRQLSAQAAVDRLQKSLDGEYRQQQALTKAYRDIDRAASQGLVTDERRSVLMGLATEKYGSATQAANAYAASLGSTGVRANDNFARSLSGTTKNAGLARHEMINLGRQAQDVGTMFAMGAAPMQIFSSQAAQIFDIFASSQGTVGGFFKQLTSGLASFATSRAGMLTGVGAIGAGVVVSAIEYADSQKTVENALSGVGRASGATLEGINRLADAEAEAAKVSRSRAREIAAAYAATGKVDPTRVSGLIGFTSQYAAQTGQGIAEASKELAGIFESPMRGAETLQKRIGGLDDTTRQWIKDIELSGDRVGAQNALIQVFSTSVGGAIERTSTWSKFGSMLARTFGDMSDSIGGAVAGTKTYATQLDDLRQQRTSLAFLTQAGGSAQLSLLDQEIARVERLAKLEQQRREAAGSVSARNASLGADEVLRGMDPRLDQIDKWREKLLDLKKAIELNPDSAKAAEWKAARDAFTNAITRSTTAAEYERKVGELNIRAINARTAAEREAIAVEREKLEIGKGVVALDLEKIRLANRAGEAQATANREAQDALRTSRDRLALAGKSPGERFRIEQDQLHRDNVERFGGTGSSALPATSAAISGLDAAFSESLRKLVAAVPGLSLGSGFRTYEQQAKLYAEKGPGWAAPPGHSRHEKGMAMDLRGSPEVLAEAHRRAAEFNLTFPLKDRPKKPEPWHVEPVGGRSRVAAPGGGGGVADELRSNAFSERDRNAYESIIGGANRELTRQNELLGLQRDAFSKSSAEIARAAKEQELLNAFSREGIDVGTGLRLKIEETAAGYAELVSRQEELRNAQDALRNVSDMGKDALKGIISDFRAGKSEAEAFSNALNRIADKLIDMAINDLFGKAFSGSGGGGGFFGTLLKGVLGGGGSGIGTTPGSGGLYSDGGFTGYGSKDKPAGIVHAGEVVWSQADIRRSGGVAVVEAMRKGSRGYDGGGIVGQTYSPTAPMVSPVPRFVHSPAANASSGPREIKVAVDVQGATGNQEVQRMVAAGVAQGMAQVRQEVPNLVIDAQRRMGA